MLNFSYVAAWEWTGDPGAPVEEAFEGDPLADLRALSDVLAVLREGRVVSGEVATS